MSSSHPRERPDRSGLRSRAAVWAVLAVLGVGGALFAGCDVGGSGDDDDEETVATTSTTDTDTDTETTDTTEKEATAPSGTGNEQAGSEPTTTTTTPDQGGGGAYDPEQDVEGNDLAPPKGSPAEQFEKECKENPGIC